MDLEKSYEQRTRVMNRLLEVLQESLPVAEFESRETSDIPSGVLMALFDGMGEGDGQIPAEIFFYPSSPDNTETMFFAMTFTLYDEVDPVRFEDISKGISYLNPLLPAGAFILSYERRMLIFRLSVPMVTDQDDELLFAGMDAALGTAVNILDVFIDMIDDLVSGQTDAGEIRSFLETER